MFEKAHVWKRLQNRYDSEPLAEQLRAVLGADTTLRIAKHQNPAPADDAKRYD